MPFAVGLEPRHLLRLGLRIGVEGGGCVEDGVTEAQLERIRPVIQRTQAETARLQTRLSECQRELAALYARYELDETAARKLQDEIVESQRQLLTAHHRMQHALRETLDAKQFERLRRRLEQALAPSGESGVNP